MQQVKVREAEGLIEAEGDGFDERGRERGRWVERGRDG
jgi:hypothetical protein